MSQGARRWPVAPVRTCPDRWAVGHRRARPRLHDPHDGVRHFRRRRRRVGQRSSRSPTSSRLSHGVHRDQLRPDDPRLPLGGFGLHVHLRDDPPERGLRHRLVIPVGLSAAADGERAHRAHLLRVVLPGRPGVDLRRGLRRVHHRAQLLEHEGHLEHQQGAGRLPDRGDPDVLRSRVGALNNGLGNATLWSIKPLWNAGVQFKTLLTAATIVCFSFIGFDAITMYSERPSPRIPYRGRSCSPFSSVVRSSSSPPGSPVGVPDTSRTSRSPTTRFPRSR